MAMSKEEKRDSKIKAVVDSNSEYGKSVMDVAAMMHHVHITDCNSQDLVDLAEIYNDATAANNAVSKKLSEIYNREKPKIHVKNDDPVKEIVIV